MEQKITIIIPCYNAQDYIKHTANSVINQSYPHWECILINDGSSDQTEDFCNQIIAIDNRFILISQVNKGLSATRNNGMKVATGEFIYFLDADDVLPLNALMDLIKSINEKSDFCIGITNIVDITNGKITGKLHHFNQQTPFIDNQNKELIIQIANEGHSCIAMNKLYRKSFLEKNNLIFENGILHEDELWFFETMFLAERVSFCWKPTYHYHTNNPNSITNNRGDKNVIDTLKILDLLMSKYYNNSLYNQFQEIIGIYIIHFKRTIYEALNISLENISPQVIVNVENVFKTVQVYRQNQILFKAREKFYFNFVKISFLPISKMNLYYSKIDSKTKKDKLIKFFLKNKAYISNVLTIKKFYKHYTNE